MLHIAPHDTVFDVKAALTVTQCIVRFQIVNIAIWIQQRFLDKTSADRIAVRVRVKFDRVSLL